MIRMRLSEMAAALQCPAPEQDVVLEKAAGESWSVAQVRAEVRMIRSVSEDKTVSQDESGVSRNGKRFPSRPIERKLSAAVDSLTGLLGGLVRLDVSGLTHDTKHEFAVEFRQRRKEISRVIRALEEGYER